MKLNLALIGSVPHKGIHQVRIHWLLDLVKVVGFEKKGYEPHAVKDSKGSYSDDRKGDNPVYDFSMLDEFLWILFENNLKPGFELMGSPSGFFTDFKNRKQVVLWKELVYQTAKRYIGIFGISYVKSWNFETWNEPDCGDFDNVSMSVQGFLNYYDACSEGLLAASSELVLGGPADGCDRNGHTHYSDGFLDHIVNGHNYFTGETGVRLDFLSYHRKGNSQTQNIINGEIKTAEKIMVKFPALARKPFYNDEADPLVEWSKSENWRADATYAAMVTKVIVQHQNIILRGGVQWEQRKFNFSLLSNDNAFLSWYPFQFTERTLNARFQINNTNPPHTQLLRKPVHSVMVLLSLLGNRQLSVNFSENNSKGHQVQNDSFIGAIASSYSPKWTDIRDSSQTSVLLYNSNDTRSSPNHTVNINIRVIGSFFEHDFNDTMIVGYTVDNDAKTGNVYGVWSKFGKPKYPSLQQLQVLRKHEGPHRFLLTKFDKSSKSMEVSLPQPSVKVLHFCTKPRDPPGQVTSVLFYNVTAGQVLIGWSDIHVTTKCILTYEVEFSCQDVYGTYIRVNKYDIIVTAFTFAPSLLFEDRKVMGYYRVRGVDYWGRGGKYSIPAKYPS
ncbi:Alpha-L-iduronidase [Mizuhopecten yessoensis]|uniref:Alpha-L-iduronidase n=1 Tax=Mizuhopecten yessoensis TaxID=6573 RepID=A0A210PTK7_MIZYE|nr:Alpha-L-iduronidase [Mizuhopecten yessoensis]